MATQAKTYETLETVLGAVRGGLAAQGIGEKKQPPAIKNPLDKSIRDSILFDTYNAGDVSVSVNPTSLEITLSLPANLDEFLLQKHSYFEHQYLVIARGLQDYLSANGVDAKLRVLDYSGRVIDLSKIPPKPEETRNGPARQWGGAPIVPPNRQRLSFDPRSGGWYDSPIEGGNENLSYDAHSGRWFGWPKH